MPLDPKRYPILIVDDEQDNLDAFRFNFRKTFDILTATNGPEALALLEGRDVAVVVTDQRMPKMTGIELLREVKQRHPETVGIILTAFTDVDVLVEAINLGQVYRYITKPWDAKEVRGVLQYAMERYHLTLENKRLSAQLAEYTGYLNQELHGKFDFGNIIGDSAALREVLGKVEQVAPTASTVLLRGETGTGKELVAHAIHINSPREHKPFVRVNCAALAPGVLESELFGHEKGSFTGALQRRPGRFELADGGTLFLDEVGDLPMEVQIKLLRTLQEREFERVGGSETIKVDVRMVSATNRNLEQMIEDNEFREDLYYRLNVFPINLPPLRDRLDDLPVLVSHFIAKFSRNAGHKAPLASVEALAKLREYTWPGNVRELENIIERAMILAHGAELNGSHLDFGRRAAPSVSSATSALSAASSSPAIPVVQVPVAAVAPADEGKSLAERLLDSERKEIVAAVDKSRGNIASAARTLGINRSTLYYRLRKHGLEHLLPTKIGVGSDEPAPDAGGSGPIGAIGGSGSIGPIGGVGGVGGPSGGAAT
jgi:two-component system, NtrC family, response regulator AtoC